MALRVIHWRRRMPCDSERRSENVVIARLEGRADRHRFRARAYSSTAIRARQAAARCPAPSSPSEADRAPRRQPTTAPGGRVGVGRPEPGRDRARVAREGRGLPAPLIRGAETCSNAVVRGASAIRAQRGRGLGDVGNGGTPNAPSAVARRQSRGGSCSTRVWYLP